MESIARGIATYLFVWLVFRIAGKRTLAQITTFDAVLLLIISETTQSALAESDNSVTNAFLLILTLLGLDVLLSCLKQRFPRLETVMDGRPLVLFEGGALDERAMQKERIDKEDILAAARRLQGIGSLSEVEFAILEQSGDVTIIPKRQLSPS